MAGWGLVFGDWSRSGSGPPYDVITVWGSFGSLGITGLMIGVMAASLSLMLRRPIIVWAYFVTVLCALSALCVQGLMNFDSSSAGSSFFGFVVPGPVHPLNGFYAVLWGLIALGIGGLLAIVYAHRNEPRFHLFGRRARDHVNDL